MSAYLTVVLLTIYASVTSRTKTAVELSVCIQYANARVETRIRITVGNIFWCKNGRRTQTSL